MEAAVVGIARIQIGNFLQIIRDSPSAPPRPQDPIHFSHFPSLPVRSICLIIKLLKT